MANEKMRELILYICARSEEDPRFGATKLNKILFYSDFLAYQRLGESITGDQYQKLENGPAPRHLVPIRDKMEQKQELVVRKREYHGFVQNQTVALRMADLSDFTGEQIAIVDEVIKALWKKSAKDVSEMSHHFAGWQLANLREDIPYAIALVAFPEEFSDTATSWLESLLGIAKERIAA